MLYHYIKDGITAEPVEENELIKLITPETLVWREGMDDWIAAKDVPELVNLFPKKQTPPPPPSAMHNKPAVEPKVAEQAKDKSISIPIKIFLGLAGVLMLIGIISILNKKSGDTTPSSGIVQSQQQSTVQLDPENHEQIKETLEQNELRHPAKYLSVTYSAWSNFINDEVIEGDINNSASTASYKDITLRVKFIAASGTILDSKEFTLFDIISFGNKLHFKKKFPIYPRQTKTIEVSLAHAKGFTN